MGCLFEHFQFILVQLLVDFVDLQLLLLNDLDCARCLALAMLTKFDRSEGAGTKLFPDRIVLAEPLNLLERLAVFEG